MRGRQINLYSHPDLKRTQRVYQGSTVTSPTSGPAVGTWKEMWDEVTPGFKKLSRSGHIINSPMVQYSESFGSSLSGYTQVLNTTPVPTGAVYSDHFDSLLNWKLGFLPNGHHLQQRGWPGSQLITESQISSLRKQLSTSVLAASQASAVQGLVFLKEIQQTLGTLRDPFKALSTMLAEGARKGFTLKGIARGASGQYLTWFYGIRSLMFDIEGILKALEVKTYDRVTFRKRDSLTADSTKSNILLHAGSALVDSRYSIYQKDTLEMSIGCLTGFDGVSYSKGLGFRLQDIPSAVWEVIPYSFVVDWFVNVGDYIQALTVDTSTGFKAQWIIEKYTTYYQRQVVSVTTAPTWTPTPCSDKDFATYVTKARSPIKLADEIGISLSNNLNKVPVLAALSLVIQRL